MHDLSEKVAGAGVDGGQTPPAEAWFAAGERIGYAPRSRGLVASEDASLRIFCHSAWRTFSTTHSSGKCAALGLR